MNVELLLVDSGKPIHERRSWEDRLWLSDVLFSAQGITKILANKIEILDDHEIIFRIIELLLFLDRLDTNTNDDMPFMFQFEPHLNVKSIGGQHLLITRHNNVVVDTINSDEVKYHIRKIEAYIKEEIEPLNKSVSEYLIERRFVDD